MYLNIPVIPLTMQYFCFASLINALQSVAIKCAKIFIYLTALVLVPIQRCHNILPKLSTLPNPEPIASVRLVGKK